MKFKASLFAIVATLYTGGFTSAQLDQVDLPIDYESSTIDYTVTDFGGNASEMVVDPENPNNSCIKSVKSACAASWAGTTISTPAGLASYIPVTNEFATVTARVYAPSAGIPILFKIEKRTSTNAKERATLFKTQGGKTKISNTDIDSKKLHTYEVDHNDDLRHGGSDDIENRSIEVARENSVKGAKTLLQHQES